MEDGRMGRCLALIQREAEMEKDFQERTDHAAIVNARAEKETALAIEVAEVHREEANELLRRHYLRERDPSLRELAKKLQAGYVCRDLRQQILHNEYKKLQDKAEEIHANNILLDALYNDQEAKAREEKNKMETTTQYCKELQQQLVNRQRQKQCQYEESLIEKKMLEEIMRTISDENKRELQQKRDQIEKMRNEMVTFKKARDAWKEKQKKIVIKEEKEIEEQRKAAADRTSASAAEKERKMRMKEELNDKIAAKIMADEEARLERENLVKLLQEQELLEANVQDDIAEKEKLERVKKDTKEALTSQMENRKRLAREEKEIEAEFRKKAEAKMAADEQKERDKARKVKEKGRLYSRELLQQIEESARRRRARRAWDCDTAWRTEVSQEREKIVREHVPLLLGYLQAGVIKKEDLPAIREGANEHDQFAELDIEAMAVSDRPTRFSKCNAQCRILREF